MLTDWLMVIITAVYVLATIFICRANIKSAEATREQVAEVKRQYEGEHRAYISYQFIFERRTWYGMRFTNHGKRVANHVQIKLSQEFLDSISAFQMGRGLKELSEKEFSLGIGQSYDIFFGADEFRSNPNKKPIVGEITYQDSHETYCEAFDIDFEKYGTIFSVNSLADDLHEDMKKMTMGLKSISSELNKLKALFTHLDCLKFDDEKSGE